MYCRNCGADIPEGATFCGNCGMKISAAPENQPREPEQPQENYYQQENPTYQSQGGYQDQGSYQAPSGPVYQQPVYGGGEDVNPTLWIVLSALEIITCCSIIPGIIGLIFAINANSKKNRGDFEGARDDIKKAKIAVFVGIGLVVLSTVFSFISGVFAAIFDTGYYY